MRNARLVPLGWHEQHARTNVYLVTLGACDVVQSLACQREELHQWAEGIPDGVLLPAIRPEARRC